MTPSEIRKLTDDFASVVRTLPAALKSLEEEYSLSDKAICDIRHYAEFNKTTRTEDRKLIRLLREWSRRRRNADDAIRIIKPLSELVAKNNPFFNELDRVRGEMKKRSNYVESERHYNPRVLHDLFGGAK
ncbi:hypothetical protein [Sporomusa sphaeroides]|uniref:Death domain-containing protein n=1 Tax=Sporomusa sphaeroides DSM 2875 TaxID=1337886 RepID=A0ABM9W029_9FIRM|nr:hypothetical protein [Sporomusa sphaeroides]OLS56408.1 hypothetical protein SPSPH_28010 [Sporomusa sphaeroides DSM 2875]CVK18503.1 hypothetical protein SSPH_01141 [Sporomusa sphaeroides DSM 2875]